LAPSQPTEEDKKTEEDEKPTEEDTKTEEDEKESSPPPVSWVQRSLEAARPYAMLARLDKPIGSWLLAWPCMWYAAYYYSFRSNAYTLRSTF
jgi:4-hydroxybenzoate polyprenyltransferase